MSPWHSFLYEENSRSYSAFAEIGQSSHDFWRLRDVLLPGFRAKRGGCGILFGEAVYAENRRFTIINPENYFSMQLIAKSYLISLLSLLLIQCSSIQSNYPIERPNEDDLPDEFLQLGLCYAKPMIKTDTNWEQVICEADISQELLQKIQFALSEEGYDMGLTFNDQSLENLNDYQRKNGLPTQWLNLKTIDALNIEYAGLKKLPRIPHESFQKSN